MKIVSPSRLKLVSVCNAVSVEHCRRWSGKEGLPDSINLTLPGSCIDELDAVLKHYPGTLLTATADLAGLHKCREFSEAVREQLAANALGAVIIDRFPVEKYNDFDNRRMCGLFASLVGPLVGQNKEGMVLYDVKNMRSPNPDKVRKSITNKAQPYHTDGGWLKQPAKYVGLYCIRNSSSGGGSRVTSLASAFNALAQLSDGEEHLCEELPWDKQGEHEAVDAAIEMNPLFEVINQEFLGRYYESYIRSGYARQSLDVPKGINAMLSLLEKQLAAQPFLSFQLERGQFQYINNRTMIHARGAYIDSEEQGDRHLVRVWSR